MTQKKRSGAKSFVPIGFNMLASLLIFFILLPLLLTLLSTSVGTLLQTLRDQVVIDSISLTFKAGALATILGLLLGVPIAYLLARSDFPGKAIIEGIIDLPTVIPRTAAGIALLLVFGRTGILGKAFAHLGITFTDRLAGIVVAMLFVSVPLLVNTSRQAFQAVNRDLEQAAQVDGASAWKVFWQISLPLAWRGVLNGAIMMFARGMSEFGAVIILAYSPKIVPVLIYERFQGYGLEAATPITVILLILILALFAVLRWLSNSISE